MFLKLVFGCWDIFFLVWVVGMFGAKRTAERESAGSRFRYWILFLAAFWLLFGGSFRRRHFYLQTVVWRHSVALGAIGFSIVVAGLGLAIWARVVLGTNWSGTITFKENHELIQRGPYAFVRHPIYTAMLLMFLGTALVIGTLAGLIALPLLFLSFWIKYRREEAVMLAHFGDRYRTYMNRVPALIPFLR